MKPDRTFYWDQAATARPKSPEAVEDFRVYMEAHTANPRRGAYTAARDVAEMVATARGAVADFVELPPDGHVVFGSGTTDALNLAIFGYLNPGDHVIASAFEHNSVLRPLRLLEKRELVHVDYVEPDDDGAVSPASILNFLRTNTRLVCVAHASNVVGNLQDLRAIGRALQGTDTCLLVDAAQTAGLVPIEMETWGAHLVVFSGHKGLRTVPGIGCLAVAPSLELGPLKVGGTGGSNPFEIAPSTMPTRLEPGSLNTAGIYLLSCALGRLTRAEILRRSGLGQELRARLLRDVGSLDGVRLTAVHGKSPVPVLSVEFLELPAAVAAAALDEEFAIEVRGGFHCAPLAHRWMGTVDQGTVRLSPPLWTTEEEVCYVLNALESIVKYARRGA